MRDNTKISTAAYSFPEIDIDDVRFRVRPHQQIVASCSGALITSLTMTPLDVIKTRLQVQQKSMLSNRCFLYCNGLMDHLCICPSSKIGNGTSGYTTTQHYKGTFDALFKISRSEGVSSLWSGLGPTLVLAIPATVIYFVCYEQLRLRIKDFAQKKDIKSTSFVIPLMAGMSARVISVTIVNPLELVRTKMQSQKSSYFEIGNEVRSLIKKQGITGLWRGLMPTLYRDVPFSGLYWCTYESIKQWYQVKNPTFGFSFLAGATSGCIAAFLTTPFDVVKTHKQIAFGEKFLYPDASKLKGEPELKTRQMLIDIYNRNGFRGLFAGVTPRVIKISPACAIMISSFELGKSFFYNRNINNYFKASNNNSA